MSTREWHGLAPRWLQLGSDPAADWRIHAEGVAPTHCELLWDGRGLYVRDRLRLGVTYAEHERVDDWLPLRGSLMLRLGAACLWVDGPHAVSPSPAAESRRWVQGQVEQRLCASAPPPKPTGRVWSNAARKLLTALQLGVANSER